MTTRQVVEKYMGHLLAGEFESAFDMFTDDAIYTITGETAISRTFHGRAAIRTDLCAILADYFKSPPSFVVRDIIVEGNRGVILADGTAEGAYGQYRQRYTFYLTIKDDKIVRKVEGVDSLPIETALLGNSIVRRAGSAT
jgi:ketosteroid isomerase-like protein